MGLDISVYTDARLRAEQPVKDEKGYWPEEIWDEEGVVHAFAYKGMERSLRGLEEDAWYVARYDHGFRAGSYSGYGIFRTDLCRAALGVDPQAVWDDPSGYAEKPFYELINFADNEGTIGPEAAADLYRDFADSEEAVMAAVGLEGQDLEWFAEKYADWKGAFRVASEGHGIVEFH